MDRPDGVANPAPELVRCPTCRAVQEWSDTCRRCRCDLRLLREAAESYRRERRRALLAIRAGRPRDALRFARRCLSLRDDAATRRLLAVCTLLRGDWPAAVALARGADAPG
jgi:hypothetical protein